MNAPLSAAHVNGGRRPIRRTGRRGPKPVEDLSEPDVTYPEPPGMWRSIPRSVQDSPARARYVSLLLSDPVRARRERLEACLRYWSRRAQALEERLEAVEVDLREAVMECTIPPAEVWRLRCDYYAAWGDVRAAHARLAEIKEALAD